MSISIYSILIIAAQVITGVHAYRHGRFFWILFIVLVPLLGTLIYFFAEMLPELRGTRRSFRQTGTQVANTLQPGRRLKQLEEELAEYDTIATRQVYAEELMKAERVDEAIDVLEGGLKGVFATDPQALFTLAHAYAEKGDYAKVQDILETIRSENPDFSPEMVRLMRARMLEAQGQTDEAIAEYRDLAQRGLSEEPRYYLVMALERQGRHDEAQTVFEDAQRYFQRSSGIYRKENTAWMRRLKKFMQEANKP